MTQTIAILERSCFGKKLKLVNYSLATENRGKRTYQQQVPIPTTLVRYLPGCSPYTHAQQNITSEDAHLHLHGHSPTPPHTPHTPMHPQPRLLSHTLTLSLLSTTSFGHTCPQVESSRLQSFELCCGYNTCQKFSGLSPELFKYYIKIQSGSWYGT